MLMASIFRRFWWVGAAVVLTGCKAEVLAPSGDIAAQQRDLLVISTLLMLIIIVPVMILTCWFAWHYRAANKKAEYQPDWDHSTKLELVIWAIPLLIIVSLGALTWVGTHLLDPYRPLNRIGAGQPVAEEVTPLRVEVVSLDWKWLFIYPEQGVATVNQLAVPVDRPVEFRLTSASVMTAFYIPAMAGMIYTMPGMETTLHGVMNKPGEYQGLASHYSGAGFSGMRFKTLAMDEAGFDDWIANLRGTGETLDRTRYLELAKASENVPPMAFTQVDPQLFRRAVNMCVENDKMCMAEMMAIDSGGGMGLSGIVNVAALNAERQGQRGTALPILGGVPFEVTGICSVEELEQMFAASVGPGVTAPKGLAPLRGLGLPAPQSPLQQRSPTEVTHTAPASGAERNL